MARKVLSKLKRNTPPLSVADRERLKLSIAEERSYLASMNRPGQGDDAESYLSPRQAKSIDTEAIESRIRRKEKALEAMSPKPLTGVEKNRALSEMRQHEEWLRKKMLSTYDMGAFPSATDQLKNARYMEACKKSETQEVGNREFQERAQRYKELARRMDPDNPELSNIERFRPRGRY